MEYNKTAKIKLAWYIYQNIFPAKPHKTNPQVHKHFLRRNTGILTIIWKGVSRFAVGGGTCLIMASSNSDIFLTSAGGSLVKVVEAHPSLAEAYKTGKSNCSSMWEYKNIIRKKECYFRRHDLDKVCET